MQYRQVFFGLSSVDKRTLGGTNKENSEIKEVIDKESKVMTKIDSSYSSTFRFLS